MGKAKEQRTAMIKVLCAVAAGIAMMVLWASSQAGPAVNNNGTRSNTSNVTASPNTPGQCPEGQIMVDGKCATVDSIHYNASKSNTGNVTAKPTGNGSPGTNDSKNISDGAAKSQADE